MSPKEVNKPVGQPFKSLSILRKPVAPQQDEFIPADGFKFNKPLDDNKKQVFLQLSANILKGDDLPTLRSKYPEIAEIGDKSMNALMANVKRGDKADYIYDKFPELQWLKTESKETNPLTPLQGGIRRGISSLSKNE